MKEIYKQFEKDWKVYLKSNKDIAKLFFLAGYIFMLRKAIKDLDKEEKRKKKKK